MSAFRIIRFTNPTALLFPFYYKSSRKSLSLPPLFYMFMSIFYPLLVTTYPFILSLIPTVVFHRTLLRHNPFIYCKSGIRKPKQNDRQIMCLKLIKVKGLKRNTGPSLFVAISRIEQSEYFSYCDIYKSQD